MFNWVSVFGLSWTICLERLVALFKKYSSIISKVLKKKHWIENWLLQNCSRHIFLQGVANPWVLRSFLARNKSFFHCKLYFKAAVTTITISKVVQIFAAILVPKLKKVKMVLSRQLRKYELYLTFLAWTLLKSKV